MNEMFNKDNIGPEDLIPEGRHFDLDRLTELLEVKTWKDLCFWLSRTAGVCLTPKIYFDDEGIKNKIILGEARKEWNTVYDPTNFIPKRVEGYFLNTFTVFDFKDKNSFRLNVFVGELE